LDTVKVIRGPQDPKGRYTTWILEDRKEYLLQKPIYADASPDAIPRSFRSGPVFVTLVRNGFVEPSTGYAFTRDRQFIQESAMKGQLRDGVALRYDSIDFAAAPPIGDGQSCFIVSNQRNANYCRWWLDQVSKYFIFDAARELHSTPASAMRYISGQVTSFQKDTLSALDLSRKTEFPEADLLHGDFYITSGLTYAGGQNISEKVRSFRRFVLDRLDASSATSSALPSHRRIYISRAKTRMRRMLNEDELAPILDRHGFVTLALEDLSVAEQISLFRTAEVVVSPHGAGLTNVMFCRPGARILEIFPRGGLHSSSFMRLATLCELGYGYLCGETVQNRWSATNPNNADIVCPIKPFQEAIATLIADATAMTSAGASASAPESG
jgi:capsular polysaccharide biosynthesis protein